MSEIMHERDRVIERDRVRESERERERARERGRERERESTTKGCWQPPLRAAAAPVLFRANMAHTRQSWPDFGVGFAAKLC